MPQPRKDEKLKRLLDGSDLLKYDLNILENCDQAFDNTNITLEIAINKADAPLLLAIKSVVSAKLKRAYTSLDPNQATPVYIRDANPETKKALSSNIDEIITKMENSPNLIKDFCTKKEHLAKIGMLDDITLEKIFNIISNHNKKASEEKHTIKSDPTFSRRLFEFLIYKSGDINYLYQLINNKVISIDLLTNIPNEHLQDNLVTKHLYPILPMMINDKNDTNDFLLYAIMLLSRDERQRVELFKNQDVNFICNNKQLFMPLLIGADHKTFREQLDLAMLAKIGQAKLFDSPTCAITLAQDNANIIKKALTTKQSNSKLYAAFIEWLQKINKLEEVLDNLEYLSNLDDHRITQCIKKVCETNSFFSCILLERLETTTLSKVLTQNALTRLLLQPELIAKLSGTGALKIIKLISAENEGIAIESIKHQKELLTKIIKIANFSNESDNIIYQYLIAAPEDIFEENCLQLSKLKNLLELDNAKANSIIFSSKALMEKLNKEIQLDPALIITDAQIEVLLSQFENGNLSFIFDAENANNLLKRLRNIISKISLTPSSSLTNALKLALIANDKTIALLQHIEQTQLNVIIDSDQHKIVQVFLKQNLENKLSQLLENYILSNIFTNCDDAQLIYTILKSSKFKHLFSNLSTENLCTLLNNNNSDLTNLILNNAQAVTLILKDHEKAAEIIDKNEAFIKKIIMDKKTYELQAKIKLKPCTIKKHRESFLKMISSDKISEYISAIKDETIIAYLNTNDRQIIEKIYQKIPLERATKMLTTLMQDIEAEAINIINTDSQIEATDTISFCITHAAVDKKTVSDRIFLSICHHLATEKIEENTNFLASLVSSENLKIFSEILSNIKCQGFLVNHKLSPEQTGLLCKQIITQDPQASYKTILLLRETSAQYENIKLEIQKTFKHDTTEDIQHLRILFASSMNKLKNIFKSLDKNQLRKLIDSTNCKLVKACFKEQDLTDFVVGKTDDSQLLALLSTDVNIPVNSKLESRILENLKFYKAIFTKTNDIVISLLSDHCDKICLDEDIILAHREMLQQTLGEINAKEYLQKLCSGISSTDCLLALMNYCQEFKYAAKNHYDIIRDNLILLLINNFDQLKNHVDLLKIIINNDYDNLQQKEICKLLQMQNKELQFILFSKIDLSISLKLDIDTKILEQIIMLKASNKALDSLASDEMIQLLNFKSDAIQEVLMHIYKLEPMPLINLFLNNMSESLNLKMLSTILSKDCLINDVNTLASLLGKENSEIDDAILNNQHYLNFIRLNKQFSLKQSQIEKLVKHILTYDDYLQINILQQQSIIKNAKQYINSMLNDKGNLADLGKLFIADQIISDNPSIFADITAKKLDALITANKHLETAILNNEYFKRNEKLVIDLFKEFGVKISTNANQLIQIFTQDNVKTCFIENLTHEILGNLLTNKNAQLSVLVKQCIGSINIASIKPPSIPEEIDKTQLITDILSPPRELPPDLNEDTGYDSDAELTKILTTPAHKKRAKSGVKGRILNFSDEDSDSDAPPPPPSPPISKPQPLGISMAYELKQKIRERQQGNNEPFKSPAKKTKTNEDIPLLDHVKIKTESVRSGLGYSSEEESDSDCKWSTPAYK